MSATQKEEVIKRVERSQLPVNQTLRKLKVLTRTYYRWLQNGSLEDERPVARRIWIRLLPQEEETVIERALEYPDRSARQPAFLMTDEGKFAVSENTSYRILKCEGLMPSMDGAITPLVTAFSGIAGVPCTRLAVRSWALARPAGHLRYGGVLPETLSSPGF